MNRWVSWARIGSLAVVALALAVTAPHETLAFDRVWSPVFCTNVASGDHGLWDDMPGAGTNNEAGLFWIVTDSVLDESCTYAASGDGVSTTTYRTLSFRVAVNDGAIFTVQLKEGSEFCAGGAVIATLSTLGAQDTSAFVIRSLALPSGHSVAEVCITLNDDPNAVGSARASALIDYIKISTGASIGWRETFTRAN